MTLRRRRRAQRTAVRCVLCDSPGTESLDRVRVEDLERLYVQFAGEDVRPEFGEVRGKVLEFVRCPSCDLRFFAPALVGSANLYSALQRFPWYYLEDKPEFAVAARYVEPGAAILEVGCGAAAFARRVPSARYLGLELSQEAAARARARGANARVESLAAHAAQHAQTYDAVVAFQVLEHLAAPQRFLLDARKCLKRNGRLIVSVPAQDSYLQHGQNYVLNLPPHHQTRWSRRALASVSDVAGLRLVAIEHDRLSNDHVDDWARVYCDWALRLGRGRLVDVSLRARARGAFAAALSRVVATAARHVRRPAGHSVTAIYEVP